MIILTAGNQYVTISGASKKVLRRLGEVTSYRVAGAHWSAAYREKFWDGREHLLKFKRGEGYRFPAGLLNDVLAALEGQGEKYELALVDRVVKSIDHVFYPWNTAITLRPYQLDAIATIMAPGRDMGRGILKMPIRSGKTKTAASIICELSVPSLFIVDSQLLLHQTRAALTDALLVDIGIIGDSEWAPENVTVATIQTLGRAKQKKDARYKQVVEKAKLVIFDECHHLKGDTYHSVMMDFDAPYKIGLSATVYLDNERENEKGVIWLKACCGDVRVDISTSKLIEEGWLMRPAVRLYPVNEPDLIGRRWSASLRDEAIYTNETRNQLIARLAAEQVDNALTVLIISNRLNQVSAIAQALEEYSLAFATVTGVDSSDTRRARINQFIQGDIDVLIGTVFAEGVDIPEIECVINAEGGRDIKATVQRLRNLTPAAGKREAVVIDFLDLTNAYFAQHSKERLKVYRSESAFKITAIKR